jgi:methionyl aminopeptidase
VLRRYRRARRRLRCETCRSRPLRSWNDEAVHGIPGPQRLREGDLVKLDVAAERDGFYADACVSVGVGRARPATNWLAAAARHSLAQALRAARSGAPQNVIGATIERECAARGYAVRPARDGWTLRTADGTLCAHEEHTIVITPGAPLVLTA